MNDAIACADAEELLGAYALDALPDHEAAQFRAHTAGCREHAAKAAELRAVASTLASSVDDAPLPAALRGRVLSAVAREPQDAVAAAPRRIDTARSVGATGRSPARPFWRSVRPLQAWGALAAAIIAALVVWNVALQSGDGGDRFDARQATSINALQAHDVDGAGSALYFAEENMIVVVADGIDQLDASRTYQMWAIDDGTPVSLGIMRPDDTGHMSSTITFDVPGSDLIAITIEPAGGSVEPTSSPVFTADLRS